MISVVNGYVCNSSCDVAKAKQGKDPNSQPGALGAASKTNKTSGFSGQPATILDGVLKDQVTTATVAANAGAVASSAASPSTVNLLV
jgi:hypothetical protein